jgi:threonine dehydrogenase-like Zn-dependent dehydrogenase
VRALLLEGDTVQVVERPAPAAPPGEVVVEVKLAGICGTDLELARGYMGYRGVLGHEFLGVVGGQRVVGEINAACGVCGTCAAGLPTHCPTRTVLGILGRDGAIAERVSLPEVNLHRVPDEVPDEQAVFVEPLAAALHVLDSMAPGKGDRVAVIGDGKLGLLIAMVLSRTSADVLLVGHHEAHLAIADAAGVAGRLERDVTSRKAFDLVVDATGAAAGLELSLSLVRPRGTLVLKSTFADKRGIDLSPIVIDEIRVEGSRCGAFPRALEALREGLCDPRPLIAGRLPLTQGEAAFAMARRPGALKILVDATA